MSLSSADEVGIDEVTQEICEQQIVIRFDYSREQDGPHVGVVILHFLGFGVVTLVGIDPDEARVGDVAIEITHNGFYTHSGLVEIKGWSKGVGVDLKTTEAISLHLIPCVEFHLHFVKGRVMCLE
jgi:hypothetical protein